METPQHHSIFDRPIAFHRAFADLEYSPDKRCGPLAALLLSQAVYWQRRGSTPRNIPAKLPGSGWWFHTEERWQDETALTPKEQQTARRRLVEAGVLEVARAGRPARLWYRVNLKRLEALFLGEIQVRQIVGTKFGKSSEPSSADPENTQESRKGRRVERQETNPSHPRGAETRERGRARGEPLWSWVQRQHETP